jgi:hypothetical protein
VRLSLETTEQKRKPVMRERKSPKEGRSLLNREA